MRLLLWATLAWLARPAGAQPPSARTLEGAVLSDADGRGVAGALVTVTRAARADTGRARGGLLLSARTDRAGRYVLVGVPDGGVVLRVRAIGFHPREFGLTVSGQAPEVAVTLTVAPTRLQPVVVAAPAAHASGCGTPDVRRGGPEAGDVERARQRRVVAGDARVLTEGDARQVSAVAEPDVLRSLERVPGVSTRDDYSVAPWTRGAPASHTAVVVDGVPLAYPWHAVGGLTVLSGDALGAVGFFPGVQPASLPGAAAGVLAVDTRRPSRGGASAELSLAAARLTASGRDAAGRVAGIVAARRSHVDLSARALRRLGGARVDVPYAFHDVVARGDVELGTWRAARWRLEASGLAAGDRLWGRVADIVDSTDGRWSSGFARATLVADGRRGTLRIGAGGSWFRAEVAGEVAQVGGVVPARADSAAFDALEALYRPQQLDNGAAHWFGEVAWSTPGADTAAGTTAGVRVARHGARLWTAGRWPTSSSLVDTTRADGTLWAGEAWGERRGRVGRAVVQVGTRLTATASVGGAVVARLLPRVAVRLPVDRAFAVTASAGRHVQLEQAVVPTGTGRNAVAMEGALRVLAGTRVAAAPAPALRATVLTAGAERWFGPSALASVQLYRRDARGVLLADPAPGALADRPLFVVGRTSAAGAEGALRWFGRRVGGAATYAVGTARAAVGGARFAVPEQRPRELRLDAHADVGWGLGASAAYARRAGSPYTRYAAGVARCDGRGACGWAPPPSVGPAGAARTPGTDRVDVGAEWRRRVRGVDLLAYGQLRNVLGRANAGAYLDTERRCAGASASGVACDPAFPVAGLTLVDRRLPPLRGVPALGVRVSR
jgi:hypothetical protein